MRYDLSSKESVEKVKNRFADFSNLLDTGETIATSTVTITENKGVVSNKQHSGAVVTFDISGGDDGDTLEIVCFVVGTHGSERLRKMYMRVVN